MPYEDVLPGDPFERWHQVTCRNYSVTECQSIKDHAFSAKVQVHPFGDLAVSQISSKVSHGVDLKVTRSNREIRKDYRDDFVMWTSRQGTITFEQAGRCTQLHAGDMMLHDQAAPFSLAFSQHSAALMVIVPRRLMLSRFVQAEHYTAMRIPSESPLARIARATVNEIVSPDCSAQMRTIGEKVWSPMLDLWLMALQTSDAQPVQPRETQKNMRLQSVQRYLRQRLSDPDVSLHSVSSDLHMSSRTLLRLFASQGTTPMHWLWEERLKSSYAALACGQFKRVSDVAYAHGFSNLAHFSRSFKALHGINAQQLVRDFQADQTD
ncbi:helix-turn-helix domain-containing protein (plasmid) [Acidovorax sp. DW039]|uniref:helix-turn-helix domain-containing protein n=1 Tax=Acidovorax sp. DW039 TaxID=3095606 RepID=UPI00308F07A0|nr:helix-turn-helix domain-containing protein [Acidovorax sp. DW039]